MNSVNALNFSLLGVARAANNLGLDADVEGANREFLDAYEDRYVPHTLSIPVAGHKVGDFYTSDYELTEADQADIVQMAIEAAVDEGWTNVTFDVSPAKDTTLGTMAKLMYYQNKDSEKARRGTA